MKIFLIILLIDVLISFSGMLYWMYKSKTGELTLNINSWHVKLETWMWNFIPKNENACPYYWSLVLNLHFLPLYLIGKYIIFPIFNFGDWICNLKIWKSKKISLAEPKSYIPEEITKESTYKYMYKKSSILIEYLFFGVMAIGLFIWIIWSGILLYTNFTWLFYIVLSIGIYAVIGVIFYILEEDEIMESYFMPFIELCICIFKITRIPISFICDIFSFFGEKIFKIYKNNCPPIQWKTT